MPPIQPPSLSQAPTTPDDTRMEEDSPSPVQTVVSHTSRSTNAGESPTLESLQEETNAIINQNKALADGYQYHLTTFEALKKHLKLVQECHMKDSQDLKDQITTLTTQIQQEQSKQPAPATTTTPLYKPIAPLPTLTVPRKLPEHLPPRPLHLQQTRRQSLVF